MKTRRTLMLIVFLILPLGYAGQCASNHHNDAPAVAVDDSTVTPIPAPGAWILVGIGSATVGYLRRKRWF